MGQFVASLLMSVDGFDGNAGFAPTSEEHQVFNDLLARTNGIVCDTENHQLLVPYWDEVGLDDPDLPEAERQFAEIFRTRRRFLVAEAVEPVDARATLIQDDPIERLREIKAETSDDLMVAAGPDLLATLFDHGLVDELEILVLPVVLGNGPRQIGDLAQTQHLALVEVRSLPSGAVFLRYQVTP
jgi:riboflavin biosynthesis pyrimidine reductase